ncbi:hypothetical protein CROQUDRAFT_17168, partial [Cronartium quercuum f. sp. fusiforme G11]
QNVVCILNVQHNCHNAECPGTLTKAQLLERHTVLVNTPEVKHLPSDSHIINASALYSSEWHQGYSPELCVS